jgi:hypothetical protein
MQAVDILDTIQKLGITVYINGDRLVCEPGSKVPLELVPEIRQHKAEIISLVCQRKAPVVDGQLPPLGRPPETEMELRR